MLRTKSPQELDAEIAAYKFQLHELESLRENQLADEKKFRDQEEINNIFNSISMTLRLNSQRLYPYQTHVFNLYDSLNAFQRKLLREVETCSDEFTIKTARELKIAVETLVDPTPNYKFKEHVINNFRNQARNARFSHETKVAAAGIVGGLIGLALWVGLTLISGGTAALFTFAGFSLAALITTFGALHFAARGDSVLRNSNPNENRGKEVSDSLKALLRARKDDKICHHHVVPTPPAYSPPPAYNPPPYNPEVRGQAYYPLVRRY